MKTFKIWYLSTEVSPFAKTGGLADVAGAFPKALKGLNQEIRLIMPKYKSINERKYILREVIRLKEIPVTINGTTKIINVKSAFLPDSKVQIYFIDIPEYFGRNGMYTNKTTGRDFPDNAERFAYFCKGALETLKILSWKPDIIHCNDWQTALTPYYLKSMYGEEEFFDGIKTVFTIHNLAYQGSFDKSMAKQLDIPAEMVEKDGEMELYGKLNLMKGAIRNSDYITTVSKTYAQEILEPELGYGLENGLQEKGENFSGILNGADYSVWSPGSDKYIPFKYSQENIEIKEQNKQALLTRVDLAYNSEIPVIGMISRVVEQKGYSILLDALEKLAKKEDFRLIILGTGDKKLEQAIEELKAKYTDKISLNRAFDDTLAHLIEAGSDMFLMPSKYEPCGMNQIYSLKYGTVPIVFKTGGLADTIEEVNTEENTGNGFVFEKHDSEELLSAMVRAISMFKNKEIWNQLRNRIMDEDFSWDTRINEYIDVYDHLVGEQEEGQ